MYFQLNNLKKIKNFYNSNGYVVIKNFIDKDYIVNLKNKVLRQVNKYDNKFIYFEKEIGKKKYFRRIEKISNHSKDVNKLVKSKKIIEVIKKLTNKKKILFKDKLNFKYPGGKGYKPHIDGHFYWKDKFNKLQKGWSIYSNHFTNVVIPLEKSDKKNGCLYLANKKDIKKLGNSWKKITHKLDEFTPNIKKNFLNKFKFYPAILNAGDILFFDWHCAHKSSKNSSRNSRMIFYATYCSKLKKIKDVRKKYYFDKMHSKNNSLIKSLQFN
jgi:2-aminoethylphosphonate dioxygenase